MVETTVHLMRHGEVENPGRVRYGRLPGFFLSERGRAQAHAAARYLASRIDRPERVIASPLERAQESAEIVRAVLGVTEPVHVDPRLTEAHSIFDGLPRDARAWHYAQHWWQRGRGRAGEDLAAVAARVGDAVRDTARIGNAVLVSHQIPIWMGALALQVALGSDRAPWFVRMAPWAQRRGPCSPASVTSLHLRGNSLANVEYWEPPTAP